MAVLPTKTEPKCKICNSEHRAEIEALLEQRSKREKDDAGNLINLEYVLEKMRGFGIVNPNADNIKNHWRPGTDKGHCQVVTEAEVQEFDGQLDELRRDQLAILDGSDGSVDGDLRAIFRLGMARLRGRIIRGEDVGVSVDHALKASAELTKRKDNEVKHQLLETLGAGMSKALEQRKEPKQIEGAEVIRDEEVVDAEVAEVAA